MTDRLTVPKEGITLRMFVTQKQLVYARGQLPDINDKKLKKDEARTGDKTFFIREVMNGNFTLSSFKKTYAVKLYDEVHKYNPF
jgi:hypothetical protein